MTGRTPDGGNKYDYNHERLFEFELARKLGMTHRELLTRMSVREIKEWQAYAQTWGTRRAGQMRANKGRQIIEW